MDDLISRQAAIDIFRQLADNDWSKQTGTSWADGYESAIEILEELPPINRLTEIDLIELEDRFGKNVRMVVEDMLKGEGKRWTR